MSVRSTVFGTLLAALLGIPLTQGAAAQEVTQLYEVRGLGMKLGTFRLVSQQGEGRYAISSQFQTSGMMQVFARIRMDMQAAGTLAALHPVPRHYLENIDTGRRQSDVTLSWSAGLPQVTAGAVNPEGTPADPSAQGDALDPASTLLIVATPRPAETLCGMDQPVFDGARRTRVRLAPPRPEGPEVTCNGQFLREAGYSADQLARARAFDLALRYVPGPTGAYLLTEARVETIFGSLSLTLLD